MLLVVVAVCAYGLSQLVARRTTRWLIFSGIETALVGVLIGSSGTRLVADESLSQLEPLITVLLGFVGFVFGLGVTRETRRYEAVATGVASALGVLLVVGAASVTLAGALFPGAATSSAFVLNEPLLVHGPWIVELYAASEHIWLGLTLAAAAAVGSTMPIEFLARHLRAEGDTLQFLKSAATASNITAVVAFGVTLAVAEGVPVATARGVGVGQWALAAAGAAVVAALLISLFIARERDSARLLLSAFAGVTLASSIGWAFGMSPLVINLVVGAVVGMASPQAPRLRQELGRLQQPLFVMVMLYAGVLWLPISGQLWLFPLVYIVARFVAFRAMTAISAGLLLSKPPEVPRLGSALLGQGTLAVSIAIEYVRRFPEHAPVVLTTVLASILAFDSLIGRSVRRVLRDAGEVDRPAAEGAKRRSVDHVSAKPAEGGA